MSDVAVSQDGQVSLIGSGDLDGDGVHVGGEKITGDDSTSVLVATFDAGGKSEWGRPGAFRLPWVGLGPNGFLVTTDRDGQVITSEGLPYLLDGDMLTSGGISINKYAEDGTHLWSAPIHPNIAGADHPGFVLALGTDENGNVYAAGAYDDTLYLPPDTLLPFEQESNGFGDVFLVSYHPDGTLRWSRRLGGPGEDRMAVRREPPGAFAVDRNGNTYTGSFYSSGAIFGEGQPKERMLPEDAHAVASYDADGSLRWVRTHHDLRISDNAGFERLAVDPAGNVFVAGYVDESGGVSTVTVGDTTFADPDNGGEFFVKLSPAGELLWARQIQSNGHEWVTGLATGDRGHLYVTGNFDGAYVNLEGIELRRIVGEDYEVDSFVAHYDENGELLWAEHIGGDGEARTTSVAASGSGDVYVIGNFSGTMRLGGESYSPQGSDNFFISSFGAESITSVDEDGRASVPADLLESFPNPFLQRTTIRYSITENGPVRLSVFDLLGREVALILDGIRQAGTHEETFDGSGLPAGVYVYRLEASGRYRTGRLVRAE